MAITLTLGGVDATAYMRVDSLDWADRLNARSSLGFDLIDPGAAAFLVTEDGTYITTEDGAYLTCGELTLAIGAAVRVEDDGEALFGGTVDAFTAEALPGVSGAVVYAVRCVSYDQLVDRHLVARSYEDANQTLEEIVEDIVAQDLAGEGITTANVAAGPTIAPIKWNYQAASKAFNDLSELTGYTWWVDADKALYFQPRSAVEAPFTITTTSGNFRNLRVETTRSDYRNRQFVKAGFGLLPSRTENLVGDGTRKAFTLAHPAGTEPTITVAAVAKTVGIRSVESGKDWYWAKGDQVVSQDDAATAVGAGVAIAVTYQGLYPILVNAQYDAEITARATAEGGTGVYEALIDEPNIDEEEAARARALGLLRRYGLIPRVATFETDTGGLRAGQIMRDVDVLELALDGDWLIESVTARDVNGQFLRYQVTIWDGEALGGWTNFFAALVNTARTIEWRDNEVIVYLRTFFDAATASESLSADNTDLAASATASESLDVDTMTPESRADYALADLSEAA